MKKISAVSFSYCEHSMSFRGLLLMNEFLNFHKIYKINLPFCNNNKPDGNIPKSVSSFIEALREADILVFSIPEYSEHYSAAFKNALDWLVVADTLNSSLGQKYCITNKPIFIITFTPAFKGAGHRHFDMSKHILTKLGADVQACFVKNNGWQEVIPKNFKFVETECHKILNTVIESKQYTKKDLQHKTPKWNAQYDEWNNKWL